MNPPYIEVMPSGSIFLVAQGADTRAWATRPGRSWPCSTLAGLRLSVTLDWSGDLLDYTAFDADSGGVIAPELDGAELTAFLDDMLDLTARVLLGAKRSPEGKSCPCGGTLRNDGSCNTGP